MSTRVALIVAETVNVICPHCQEPQPNPDNGADNWSAAEIRKRAENTDPIMCVSCDAPMRVRMTNRVGFGQ